MSSNPRNEAETVRFIESLLAGSGTEQCLARLVATGIVQRVQEFIGVEIDRRTQPMDLLLAIASIQAGILSATMSLCFKAETRLAASEQFLDLYIAQVRAALNDAAGRTK